MLPKIGFIGTGIMGRPMAKNLLKAGYELYVYNRTREKADALIRLGARRVDSPKDAAAKSDIVISIVSDTPDVYEVLLGSEGVIRGAHSGLTVIDMSTVSADAVKDISRQLAESGVHMLDAPVSGGEAGAIAGTLTIMAGGEKEVFEACLPIFLAMGSRATYMGPSGCGQITKLGNQIAVSLNMLGICEAFLLASKENINPDDFMTALLAGSAQSSVLSVYGPKIIAGDYSAGFFVKLLQKDLRLVAQSAASNEVALPGTALVQQLYNAAGAIDPENGHQALMLALESLNNYKIASKIKGL